jgi:hypothetical protein
LLVDRDDLVRRPDAVEDRPQPFHEEGQDLLLVVHRDDDGQLGHHAF